MFCKNSLADERFIKLNLNLYNIVKIVHRNTESITFTSESILTKIFALEIIN